MRQDLYDKINGDDADGNPNDPGGDASAVAAALAARTVSVERPLDERMISERRVYAVLGMFKGEALMSLIEANAQIPARVKAWFKPSEEGVDVLDPTVPGIIAMAIADSVNTGKADDDPSKLSDADGELLLSWGYTQEPEFPGVNATMVQNARDQINRPDGE